MRALDDQNHYQVLEISRGVSAEEIERAYRIAKATYGDDSLALYSMFDGADAQRIRERVELAYRILMDEDSRRDYDASLNPDQAEPTPPQRRSGIEPSIELESLAQPQPVALELPMTLPSFEDPEAAEEEEGMDFDGASLRRARVRRGIELDQISGITKISFRNLTNLEEDRFEDLPAPVYVRGFVGAYARTIGLDPKRVSGSYMAHYEEATHPSRRGGLLGRR